VRPLRQMTGQAEFNEVYLTDVRIPDANRMGEVGDGWRVSLTTLMNERVLIGGGVPGRGDGVIKRAVRAHASSPAAADGATRAQLMQLWAEAEVSRLTNWRASQLRASGNPGPEGSVGKAVMSGLNQRISSFVLDLQGPDGMLYPDGYPEGRGARLEMMRQPDHMFFLRARANSIEGGTSEIMRNIMGERVLGLPGEPRIDKDLPWSDVPR